MNILSIPGIILKPRSGWLDPETIPRSLANLFLLLVLPLSALPPLLLDYAGKHYGDAFVSGFGGKPWAAIAIVFFVAELLTFLGMSWFIVQVAADHQAPISKRDAAMLAGIAATPLWLSSLTLLVPSLAFAAAVVITALAASCRLVYHGMLGLCRMGEVTTAAAMTQTVMGAGLAAWALLLLIVVAL